MFSFRADGNRFLKGPRKYVSIRDYFEGHRAWLWFASMGLLGFFSFMPGTLASAVVTLAYGLGLGRAPLSVQLPLWFLTTLLGIRAARVCEERLRTPDPSFIVVDEWSGQWIALMGLPLEWPWLVAAFLIFRFLDVVKPLGLRRLERLPHGFGVMTDDIVAGVVTGLSLHGVRWLLH
jgi:phosphatidylglycerophosphatase A